MSDHTELNELMAARQVRPAQNTCVPGMPSSHGHDAATAADLPDTRLRKLCQWTTDDGRRFVPASHTTPLLPPGFYEIKHSPHFGVYFEAVPVKTEGLVRFPQTNGARVVREIQTFWERGPVFDDFRLIHKRGILLWEPPGSGKSCTIQLVMQDVIARGGVVVRFDHPDLFMDGMRPLREVQAATPVVILMEDVEALLRRHDESQVLNLLDGVELLQKTCFLATTNHPEDLGPRIVNRPSRFDKRFKIGHPDAASRRLYFEHLAGGRDLPAVDVRAWVADTAGFSIAHLKELFVAVVILGDAYADAVETLRTMRERIDPRDDDAPMGFGAVRQLADASRRQAYGDDGVSEDRA